MEEEEEEEEEGNSYSSRAASSNSYRDLVEGERGREREMGVEGGGGGIDRFRLLSLRWSIRIRSYDAGRRQVPLAARLRFFAFPPDSFAY